MIHIILPVHNEEKTIESTIKSLLCWCKKNLSSFELIFVNDHSTDNTAPIIRRIGFEYIKLVNNDYDKGKGSAIKAGYLKCRQHFNNDDLVVFLDSDGQIDVSELKTFLSLMQIYQADVVVGNKRHDYSITDYSLQRMIVSKTYNFLIRMMFGFNLRDTQCGIKLFRKPVLDLVMDKVTVKRFAFDLELLVAIRGVRLRVVDAPVKVKPQPNKGSVNLKNIVDTFVDTLKVFLRHRAKFYQVPNPLV